MNVIPYSVSSVVRGARFRLTRKLKDRDPVDVWPGLQSTMISFKPFLSKFGNLKLHELILICSVAKHLKVKTVFEFGTFDGLSAWHLAHNLAPHYKIYTLDLPLDHPARAFTGHDREVGLIKNIRVNDKYAGTPEEQYIQQVFCDSMEFDPKPLTGKMDLCFIDAGHGFEHVQRDTENALVMTKPGGVIFWHDYSRWWPGVQKCLDSLSSSYPVFRVKGTALGAVQLPL